MATLGDASTLLVHHQGIAYTPWATPSPMGPTPGCESESSAELFKTQNFITQLNL